MSLFGGTIKSTVKFNIDEMLSNIDNLKSCGANLIQIMLLPNKKKQEYDPLKSYLIKNNIHIVIHASYNLNLAKEWTEHSSWIHQFLKEIRVAEYIGAFGIVLHMGKQMNLTKEEAINNMYSSLIYIYNQIKDYKIRILLETSTGQGTEMGYELEDFAKFFNKFAKHKNIIISDKFRVCLDTCHIFQAGNDISDVSKTNIYLKKFDNLIGLKYIGLIHLNDSLNQLGFHIDRHESLGKGHIGHEVLRYISKFFIEQCVPIILETPKINMCQEIIDYYKKIENTD